MASDVTIGAMDEAMAGLAWSWAELEGWNSGI